MPNEPQKVLLDKLEAPVYSLSIDKVLEKFHSSSRGLSSESVEKRIEKYGLNAFPKAKLPGLVTIFARQFVSPLIYVLLVAAIFSLIIEEWSDAGFIAAVLVINALIGAAQEYSAQKAAVALQNLVTMQCRVIRDGDNFEIDAEFLVPGDIVLLGSGDKVPADIRLLTDHDLQIDESLLTGESLPIAKKSNQILSVDDVLADRINMLFAGTLVIRGRAKGVVTSTGMNTELGSIAADVLFVEQPKAPLQVRMTTFTQRVAIMVGIASALMLMVSVLQGTSFAEMFLLAVALAVSAIPEGLPVALTIALAIGMRRMVKKNVIVRRLLAVEALGSCTYIATDKTGTLTVNQLTAKIILLPDNQQFDISGQGVEPIGQVFEDGRAVLGQDNEALKVLLQTSILANEGFLGHSHSGWAHHGDVVDVAFLVMAHKAGINRAELNGQFAEIDSIPYESERMYSASLNVDGNTSKAHVKGALETLLPMCSKMLMAGGEQSIDSERIAQQAQELAKRGYRVLALASGIVKLKPGEEFSQEHLHDLTLLGIVGIIDPLRSEAKASVFECRQAGVQVAMITGDHPATALAIAKELDLANDFSQVVTGQQLSLAKSDQEVDFLTQNACVFARVGPHQKLDIVQSLQRNGHFVAVSGDGANDAPALRAAQVGVAMGKNGTDVAREAADLIITDDNFKSIVSGIEQGRVAYANVRKVIFLLISTGAAEIVLFALSLLAGLPIPLLAVQLLWLNLVTNGIQDVALAFEPAEGNELKQPPRSPKEPIFNRLMIERVLISAFSIGIVAFLVFQWLLARGFNIDEARNGTLLLMVLFENVHVFNSRSETRSVFTHNPLANPLLLLGTLAAQLVHISAMYTPWLSDILGLQPVSLIHWAELLLIAFTVLVVMELHKLIRR